MTRAAVVLGLVLTAGCPPVDEPDAGPPVADAGTCAGEWDSTWFSFSGEALCHTFDGAIVGPGDPFAETCCTPLCGPNRADCTMQFVWCPPGYQCVDTLSPSACRPSFCVCTEHDYGEVTWDWVCTTDCSSYQCVPIDGGSVPP